MSLRPLHYSPPLKVGRLNLKSCKIDRKTSVRAAIYFLLRKYISNITTNVNNENIQIPNWNMMDNASYTLTGITSFGGLADLFPLPFYMCLFMITYMWE